MSTPPFASLPQPHWYAWYDGSALPNPGKIGLGVLIRSPSGESLEHSRIAREEGCNNEAELYALCQALHMAYSAGARQITLTGDSDFVVQHLQGKASTAVPRFQALLARARTLMARFEQVDLRWVPRHRNTEANALARRALGLSEE